MEFLAYAALALFFLIAPLLGISAYLRIGKLEKTQRERNNALNARLSILEAELEQLRQPQPMTPMEIAPPAENLAIPVIPAVTATQPRSSTSLQARRKTLSPASTWNR